MFESIFNQLAVNRYVPTPYMIVDHPLSTCFDQVTFIYIELYAIQIVKAVFVFNRKIVSIMQPKLISALK